MSEKYLLNADDVAMRLEVSKAKAYKVIKELNEELKKMGFIIIAVAGKCQCGLMLTIGR